MFNEYEIQVMMESKRVEYEEFIRNYMLTKEATKGRKKPAFLTLFSRTTNEQRECQLCCVC